MRTPRTEELNTVDIARVNRMFTKALTIHAALFVMLIAAIFLYVPRLEQNVTCTLSKSWFSQLWHLNASYASKLQGLTTEGELCRFLVSNSVASAIGVTLIAARVILVRNLSNKNYFRRGAFWKLSALLALVSFAYFSFDVKIQSTGRFYPSFITGSGSLNFYVPVCIYIIHMGFAEVFSFMCVLIRSHFPWSS